ncbi:MAG TPA: DUF1572 family protein [Blastocatellia bacterium]|nr:DUF1572 family protein [Blastocatellia bacterium]
MSNNELFDASMDALRSRIIRILPAQIRECLTQLSDDQLWWRANDESNSIGNLVLHVSGSIRHYLVHRIGGMEYKRDRAAEFSERGPIPREHLLEIFNETMRQADQVLAGFDENRLVEPTDEPAYFPTVFHAVVGIGVHLSFHAGQIVYATKMLREGGLDDLWIRAHRSAASTS